MLRICTRMGWSIERDWMTLSAAERTEWLAFEHYLRQESLELMELLADKNALDGGAYAQIRMDGR